MADKCYLCNGSGIDGMKGSDPQSCTDCGGSGWADPAARIKELENALPKVAEVGIKAGSALVCMRQVNQAEIDLVLAAVIREAQGTKKAAYEVLRNLDPEAMIDIYG